MPAEIHEKGRNGRCCPSQWRAPEPLDPGDEKSFTAWRILPHRRRRESEKVLRHGVSDQRSGHGWRPRSSAAAGGCEDLRKKADDVIDLIERRRCPTVI